MREDLTKITKPFARISEKSSCDSLDLRENPRTRGKSRWPSVFSLFALLRALTLYMGKNSLFPQKPFGKSGEKGKSAVFAFASDY